MIRSLRIHLSCLAVDPQSISSGESEKKSIITISYIQIALRSNQPQSTTISSLAWWIIDPARGADEGVCPVVKNFIKENKKVRNKERNDALHQENDQEKKKVFLFFLVAFLVESVFSFFFLIAFLVKGVFSCFLTFLFLL